MHQMTVVDVSAFMTVEAVNRWCWLLLCIWRYVAAVMTAVVSVLTCKNRNC